MNIEDLYLPYPDFKLQEIIDPEQFDVNNEYTVNKINEVLAIINQITNGLPVGGGGGGSSEADLISLKPIIGFVSTNLQNFLEDVIAKLTGSGGGTFIGTPVNAGVSGTSVGAQLRSLKVLLDAQAEKLTEKSYKVATATDLVQKKVAELNFGFDNGVVNTEIFTGASKAPQGMAFVRHLGVDKMFVLQRVLGATAWGADEQHRIVEFNLGVDGATLTNVSYSQVMTIGHQGISAISENGKIYIYTGITNSVNADTGKGFCKIEWKGSSTSQTDAVQYVPWGLNGTGHMYETFNKATISTSMSGKYMLMIANDYKDDSARYCFVYDRLALESTQNEEDVAPLKVFKINNVTVEFGYIMQDVACDDEYIYFLRGHFAPHSHHMVQVYDMLGNEIRRFGIDDARAEYGKELLLDHPTLGVPSSIEPEGLTIRDGKLLVLVTDSWRSTTPIVSHGGFNWGSIIYTTNVGKSPYIAKYWVKTKKPATHGVWNVATVYPIPGAFSRVSKCVFSIMPKLGNETLKPVDNGIVNVSSGASSTMAGGSTDVTIIGGDAYQVKTFYESASLYKNLFSFNEGNKFRVYDANDGADNTSYFGFNNIKSGGRDYGEARVSESLAKGAGFNAYGKADSTSNAGAFLLYAVDASGASKYVKLDKTFAFMPNDTGVQNLGSATSKWGTVYASTATINTSDRNYKQQISAIDDRVLDAWSEMNYCQFKFNDAVEAKGDHARFHIGLISQEIQEAFERHGLDAMQYGLICYDKWDYSPAEYDAEGRLVEAEREAGELWSIRADECQFLEMALMRRELQRLREATTNG
jgi:hypothetical protein